MCAQSRPVAGLLQMRRASGQARQSAIDESVRRDRPVMAGATSYAFTLQTSRQGYLSGASNIATETEVVRLKGSNRRPELALPRGTQLRPVRVIQKKTVGFRLQRTLLGEWAC